MISVRSEVQVLPGPPIPSLGARPAAPSGGVAQLGERLLCKQEVDGSIPFTSTILARRASGLRGYQARASGTVFSSGGLDYLRLGVPARLRGCDYCKAWESGSPVSRPGLFGIVDRFVGRGLSLALSAILRVCACAVGSIEGSRRVLMRNV